MNAISRTLPRPVHPLVEHWDDERSIGNGILVTLMPGLFFYDDCGVMGFETAREAKQAVAKVAKRKADAEALVQAAAADLLFAAKEALALIDERIPGRCNARSFLVTAIAKAEGR